MAASATKRMSAPIKSVGSETAAFLWHKIKGLMPDLYIAWIIAFIVTCWTKQFSLTEILKNLLLSSFDLLFLVHTGLSGFRANGAAWYLSAMLLAMAILYPILIRKRDLFLSLLAPLISVFLFGYMYQNWSGALGSPATWVGFATKGLIRGIAEISLGCVCYSLCQKLKPIQLTRLCRALLTFIEAGCYFFVIGMAFSHWHGKLDYLLVLSLSIGITITFSQKSYSAQIFKHPIYNWLGVFSYDLYLSHGFWSHAMNKMFPAKTYWQIFPYYLAIAFATAMFVMLVSKLLRQKLPTISEHLKKLLVQV